MPVLVPCFCCFLFQKILFWKYPQNWTKIYRHFLFVKTKLEPEGGPWGAPRGQGQPLATAPPGPVGDKNLCFLLSCLYQNYLQCSCKSVWMFGAPHTCHCGISLQGLSTCCSAASQVLPFMCRTASKVTCIRCSLFRP